MALLEHPYKSGRPHPPSFHTMAQPPHAIIAMPSAELGRMIRELQTEFEFSANLRHQVNGYQLFQGETPGEPTPIYWFVDTEDEADAAAGRIQCVHRLWFFAADGTDAALLEVALGVLPAQAGAFPVKATITLWDAPTAHAGLDSMDEMMIEDFEQWEWFKQEFVQTYVDNGHDLVDELEEEIRNRQVFVA